MQDRGEVIIGLPMSDPHVFPTRVLLEPRDPAQENQVGVYAKQLRLGGSQIELRYFRRGVLDRYRHDPRYELKENRLSGHIHTRDNAPNMQPSDRVRLQSFGAGYGPDGTSVVAVILWRLGELSREHQQYWASFEVEEACKPDAHYITQNFNAKPVPIIAPKAALLGEIQEINTICNLMGEPALFRSTYKSYQLSRLGTITKPTAEEFGLFVLELDKLLGDNINKGFFKDKVALKDSKGQGRGSLSLLEEYLRSFVLEQDSPYVAQICGPLKRIRKLRQRPAHEIAHNEYCTAYWVEQRELLEEALKAIRLLRRLLAKQLTPGHYLPPDWLDRWPIK